MTSWTPIPQGQDMYLIALLPHTNFELWTAVKGWQREVSDKFASHRAKSKPPHITLFAPFRLPVNLKKNLHQSLQKSSSQTSQGYVDLSGFGAFPKHTVFLKAVKTDWLYQLRATLHLELQHGVGLKDPSFNPNKPESFYPHMTVGYRDLSPEQFENAWQYFKDISCQTSFEVRCLFLLKWSVPENRWKKAYEYALQDL